MSTSEQFQRQLSRSRTSHWSWEEMFTPICGLKAISSSAQFRFLADAAAEMLEQSYQMEESLDLISWLRDVRIYVDKQAGCGLLKSIIHKGERLAMIDDYYGRLTTIASNLQVPGITYTSKWKDSFNSARRSDQEMLNRYLNGFAINQGSIQIYRGFGFDEAKAVPTMVSLQRYINDKIGDEQEIRFIKTAISYIFPSILEDLVVDVKPCIITSFDVDIGSPIGAGSLGTVFRGRWKRKDVAIKMLKPSHNITPISVYLNSEMEKWSKLHHPNVLPFLGGHALDNEPFVVFPFLKRQTSRHYIHKYPDCDHLRLLYETSLGLLYLHSQKLVHGNIRGLNILIDDDGKPQLCDYGLGKLKEDINSHSSTSSPLSASQYWMAPELFDCGILTFKCDIYSFGMTMYEILADDVPLGYVPLGRLYNRVVERDERPARPEVHEAPQFSDAAWRLAERCWKSHPTHRIKLSTLSEQLGALLPSSEGDGLPD